MRKGAILLTGAALALSSTLALAERPQSILPPGFDDQPAPSPAPSSAPAPTATSTSTPVVQPLPGSSSSGSSSSRSASSSSATTVRLPANVPSAAELERMSENEVEELFGIRPSFDIPPQSRRKLERIGVLSPVEGGLESEWLDRQPGTLVQAALNGIDGPLISRWGHIALRRVLLSRLNTPERLRPTAFAALRARALNTIGEPLAARALLQDIDSENYTSALAGQALRAALGTGDVLAVCPVALRQSDLRDDTQWRMATIICNAFDGDTNFAQRRIDQMVREGDAAEIDLRLAERFVGTAGDGRRSVTIEWDGVDALSDWRWGLASALGIEFPESLSGQERYRIFTATSPATPLPVRADAAMMAAARGVLSSEAMVDLYSQVYAAEGLDGPFVGRAARLRDAYVAESPAQRIAAMRDIWSGEDSYGALVLTAYAAARLPVDEEYAADAERLIASMLTAGLDANAMRWGSIVDEGSAAWGLLALAQPERDDTVGSGALDSYVDDDASTGQRKSAFLVAGLAGLGRLDEGDLDDFSDRLGLDLARQTKWSRMISQAGTYRNPALAAILAGLGMQGQDWDDMTPRHLFYIVQALNQSGMQAEARMIAAEAVARG